MKSKVSQSVADQIEIGRTSKAKGHSVQLQRPTAQPLYLQVKDHLIRRVLAGEWGPGECLPSEMKLADEYELSQGTVRKAIEEMAVEGLVSRHPGRGTFVTSHRGEYQPARFLRFYANNGERISGSESPYIKSHRVKVDARAAAGLQLKPGSDVAEIVRVRHFNDLPVLVESIMLHPDLCPEAERVFAQREPGSIYLALEQIYNILVVRVDERLRARGASKYEAKLLGLRPNSPILEVERHGYSLGGQRVEWRLSVCNSDVIHYQNQSS